MLQGEINLSLTYKSHQCLEIVSINQFPSLKYIKMCFFCALESIQGNSILGCDHFHLRGLDLKSCRWSMTCYLYSIELLGLYRVRLCILTPNTDQWG